MPVDGSEPRTPYIFFSKVSDNPSVSSNAWYLDKIARISFTIVGNNTDDDQLVIETIRDTITNEIVRESCVKIEDFNGVLVSDITEDTESPLFYNDKDRQFVTKDYLFTYSALV